MVYQGFKFIFVRLGVTVMVLMTVGYSMLYALHEVFFRGVRMDDSVLKWSLLGTSLFVGFIAFGFLGDWRFTRALRALKTIDLKAGREAVESRFRGLLRFTYSSSFWPKTAKRMRNQVVQEYADYLLATGAEDAEAQRTYLQAFLSDPEDIRFRDVVVSTLTRKEDPTAREIEVLLLMIRTQNREDSSLLSYLTHYFLDQKLFNHKSEPVFLKALQMDTGQAPQIVHSMLPVLLEKDRQDANAIEFYLAALTFAEEEQVDQLKEIIGKSFAAGRFEVGDPVLHEKCAQIFYSLDPEWQSALQDQVEEERLSGKWKRVKLITREDRKTLKSLLQQTGAIITWAQALRNGLVWCLDQGLAALKGIVLKAMDAIHFMGTQPTRIKFAALGFVVFFGLISAAVIDWKLTDSGASEYQDEVSWEPDNIPDPGSSTVKDNRTFAIQVAAVVTQRKADKLISSLKRNSVDGVYVVKVERKKGGYWYKIRVGTFSSKEAAQDAADQMVQRKLVRNYFLIKLNQTTTQS